MSHQGGGVGIFIYIPRTAIDIAKRSCVVHVLNLCFQIMVFVSTRKLSKVFVQLGDSVMIRKAMPFACRVLTCIKSLMLSGSVVCGKGCIICKSQRKRRQGLQTRSESGGVCSFPCQSSIGLLALSTVVEPG